MLIKILIIFTLFSTIKSISTNRLLDLPIHAPQGSIVINATLNDITGDKKYFIQELISVSGATIKGKISVSSDKDSYDIHYNVDSGTGVYNKERLVIHGSNCLIINFKNDWDKTLPGLEKSLLNEVLLLGPSLYYRFAHSSFAWKSVDDKNVRGNLMKGSSTEINDQLKVTFYYKRRYDYQFGLENPSRIEFSGYDSISGKKVILSIDIYSTQHYDPHVAASMGIAVSSDIYSHEVQPSLGIGCEHYLSGNKPIPKLKSDHFQLTMEETVRGSTNSRKISEIYAAENYDFLRIKSTLNGETTETYYDYALGVSFQSTKGGDVSVASIDSHTPGINLHGLFSAATLFELEGNYKYLGKVNLESRSGFPAEVWESVKYNVYINDKKVDKAVVTQYFIESHDEEDSWGLFSTKITVYDYDVTRKVYNRKDEITRKYINFQVAQSVDDIRALTEKSDYVISDEKVILNFVLKCDSTKNNDKSCIKYAEQQAYYLKADLLYHVILSQPVSLFRIDDIQYRFSAEKVEMEVTFIDMPHLAFIFNSKSIYVSQETLNDMEAIKADSETECLNDLSEYKDIIKTVIYCPSDRACGFLSHPDDLKEDTKKGQKCDVFQFPLNNLHRVKQELTIDQIHDAYKQVIGTTISMFSGGSPTHLKIVDIVDKTKKEIKPKEQLVTKVREESKLKLDEFTATVPGVKNFADCYRNCHESEQVSCISFSYCNNKGQIDCRVSNLEFWYNPTVNDEHVESDSKCEIFSISVLEDYSKVSNRKFKNPISTAVEKDSLESCAKACSASKSECLTFQYCDGSCSFGDMLYSDDATEYDPECYIYTTRTSEIYQKTGHKIVSEVLHTESKLTLDQCATMCYETSEGDETGCKSFNYCPKSKSESSCQLTRFSVKNSNTKTSEGGHCSNYELKSEWNSGKGKKSSPTKMTKGTSSAGAFGLIMLFIIVGGLLGFVAPNVYSKVVQMRNASKTNEDFSWTRQINEPTEQIEDVC